MKLLQKIILLIVFGASSIFAQSYTITTSSNPANGGSTSGGGTYNHGDQVDLVATANTGYTFVNWTEGGTEVSTSANYSFTAESDRDLVANFSLNSYTITTSSNPANGGSTSGGGTYNHGDQVDLVATANTGYTFVNWTEGGTEVSTSANYSFTAESDRDLVANFSLNSYTITTSSNPTGGGSTSGGGTYNHGDQVDLTATANTGYTFVNWTEGGTEVSTSANYSFTAESDRDLVANFSLNSYTITTSSNPTGGGSTSGGGTYNHGDQVDLVATANTGYTFVNWTEGGTEVSTSANYSFMAESDRDLVANFQINSYSLNIAAGSNGSGKVKVNNVLETLPYSGTFDYNSVVNLEAVPDTGSSFTEWSGDLTGTANPTTITIDTNKNVTANFTLIKYEIITSSSPLQGGTTTGGGMYDYGTTAQVVATPNSGWEFTNWKENGIVVSSDSIYSFVVTENRTLVAEFGQKTHVISTSSSPSNGGTTSGGATYPENSSATVTAFPSEGWQFVSWTENAIVVSTDSLYTFIVLTDRNLVANFEKKQYNIVTSSTPADGGNTSGAGVYTHGDQVTLSASPNEAFNFIDWSDITTGDTIKVSENPSYSFIATSNKSFLAHFDKKTYTISTSSSPAEGGITKGDSIYTHGDNVTVTAIPNTDSGWDFVNWTENGNIVSTNLAFTFTASANRQLVANFQLRTYNVVLSANPSDAGSVSGADTYTHGTSVSVIATPQAGWLFVNWTENDVNVSNTATYTFDIVSNRNLIANFAHDIYSINATPSPGEGGIVSGSGSFYFGQTATLIATPNPGWEFVNWTKNGTEVSKDSVYVFTVTESSNYIANFKLADYTINCSANPSNAGFTTGCGFARYGQEITVIAEANSGWEFINWTEGGVEVSTDAQFTFTVEGNRDLIANFDFIDGIEEFDGENSIPEEYYLSNAYPNPFNPETTLRFGLPEESTVKIMIFDISGQLVRTVLDNAVMAAGNYVNHFYADNLTSGIYFYIISIQSNITERNFNKSGKLLLLK